MASRQKLKVGLKGVKKLLGGVKSLVLVQRRLI